MASDPIKVFFTMESGDSSRRYIRCAVTAPAAKVRSAKSPLAVDRSIGWFPLSDTYLFELSRAQDVVSRMHNDPKTLSDRSKCLFTCEY